MKFKNRRGQSGQAIAELTISLVAFMAAFIGFLFISDLSIHSVQNYIKARGEADEEAAENTGVLFMNEGQYIYETETSADRLRFTYDDQTNNSTDYHLTITDPDNPTVSFTQVIEQSSYPLAHSELMNDLPEQTYRQGTVGNIFISGANLTEGEATYSLPSDNENISEEMIMFLVGRENSNITITDKAYMPAK